MNLTELPAAKREAILSEFGDEALAFVDGYPGLVTRCIQRFAIRLTGVASAGLPINIIYFAETDAGEPVVLKLGYPHPEQITEMIALRHYQNPLMVRMLDCDETLGAVLLARARPGTTFRESARTIARSSVLPEVIGALPMPVESVSGLPTFDHWLDTAFARFHKTFPTAHPFAHHVERATKLYEGLRQRHPGNWLLHGDLHHENILQDQTHDWLAIDPKGVIGPRVMECGRFLHNFLADEIEGAVTTADASLARLCEILATRYALMATRFRVDQSEIASVAYIDCVLCFCWTINSEGEWLHEVKLLDAVQRMLP